MSFKVTVRGSRMPMVADYECPVHGRFEARVQRDENGDPPATISCLVDDTHGEDNDEAAETGADRGEAGPCGQLAEYCMSAPLARVRRIEALRGKSQKPERATWTDTRNVAEGQPVYEWQEDRAKVWEAKRKQDVYNFAREHNERVIGGD